MGTKFRPYDPDQILMLPPDLREWLPEGHLAHHVSDLVDAVKLSAFYAPYDPRMLAAGNFPKHRMLCEFRWRHLADFRAVFAEVVALARASGLVELGRVAVDGTKVRANASKRKAMSYGRMVKEESRLAAEIEELVKRAEATDEAEDERFGREACGDELA